MLIDTAFDEKTETLTIILRKDFDYSLTALFEQAYRQPAKQYVLEMAEVTYLDSSALGLLLHLREYAFAQGASVTIMNMNDVVLEIFRVLNFHKIFKPTYVPPSTRIYWVAKP
jgi:HptB-dependent secretion and biofilm anti anti-sigma factor